MLSALPTQTGVRAAFSGRTNRAVSVKASKSIVDRRDFLGLLAVIPSFVAAPAFALIPDDDDEELVEKAKARRVQRIKEDKEVSREFVSASGFRDRSIEVAIVPLQTGVYKLAMAGEQIEGGDLTGASATLKAEWVADFLAACTTLSLKDNAKDLVPEIVSNISSTASYASAGDLAKTKVSFVSLVEKLESWAVGAGVTGSVKGL